MSERKNDNRSREVEQNLIDVSRLEDAQLFEKYKTEPEGLNQVEAADRLEEYGRNIIDVSNENSLFLPCLDGRADGRLHRPGPGHENHLYPDQQGMGLIRTA